MKFSLLIFLLSVFASSLQGQNEEASDSVSVEQESQVETEKEEPVEDTQKLVWVSLYGGTGLFQWIHSEEAVTSEPAMAFGGGLGINFRIVDWFEVSTGARFSSFSPELKVESFKGSMMAVDNEGDEYEKRVSASRVVEEQEFVWAGFPLSIRYVFNPGRWDLYAEAGAEYCLALKSSFDQTGRFSHHGYYSEYDLLIDDLPSNGFYDEMTLTSTGELDPESFIMPFVAAGMVFPGEVALFFIEGRYYLPGNEPFSEKQDFLFQGPLNNESAYTFSNASVLKSGKVTLSGFRGVIGIRF